MTGQESIAIPLRSAAPGSLVESDTATRPEMPEVPTVVVDRQILCWLVMAALTDICAAADDIGCCPVCCAPCTAVKALLDTGQLDDTVRERGPGWDWWDDANTCVDRGLLERAWRLTGCHDNPAKELR